MNKYYKSRLEKNRKKNKLCTVIGCDGPEYVKGYCTRHYNKFLKYGDPEGSFDFVNKGKTCSIPTCEKKAHAKGCCKKHYTELFSIRRCSIQGCENPHHANGYCSSHENKRRKHGDPLWEKNNKTDHKQEYRAWINMKRRCLNPDLPEYKNYGGRGIVVCDSWINDFNNFLKDLGKKPFESAQIDRIDNNGNYEPQNCRWVTPSENNRNKRTNVIDMETAREIRKVRNETGLSCPKIGEMFNINSNTVTDVCLNRSWREL